MEYIKITANSQSEALQKLRQLYGNDAYLFEEKWIEPDTFLGKLFGKKRFQITVGIPEKKTTQLRPLGSKTEPLASRTSYTKKSEDFRKDELLQLLEEIRKNRLIARELPPREDKESFQAPLQKIARDIEVIKENIASRSLFTPTDKDFFGLREALFKQGFSARFVDDILSDARLALAPQDYRNFRRIYEKVKVLIEKRIRVSPGLGEPQVIALIGPTGAGKTTTLAKIAAELALRRKRKIELITLDNFRIAATEQLKVYGNIMGVPVRICMRPEEFRRAVEESTAEMILVDNTGFAASNDRFLEEQKAFYDALPSRAEKHLVLPANMKAEEGELVMEKFAQIGYDKLILSKIDESLSFGAFIELSESYHRPFSYFTTGQNVPDDIMEARGDFLAEKVLERYRQKNEGETLKKE